jgi:hypothetical protein
MFKSNSDGQFRIEFQKEARVEVYNTAAALEVVDGLSNLRFSRQRQLQL